MRLPFLLAPAILIASMSTIGISAAQQQQQQSGASYEQQKAACRQEGMFNRNLSGDNLARFVDDCVMQGSGTSAAAPPASYEAKAQACRRQGEFQEQLSGSALQAFVAKCVGQ